MSFSIAICNEDKKLLNMLAEHCKKLQLNVVSLTTSGKDFIKTINECYPDIFMIDIKLADINGIEVVKEITKNNYLTKVILTSESSEYYKEAVNLYCYDYIQRSSILKRLPKTINRLTKELSLIKQNSAINKVKIKQNRNEVLINVDDIIYIQKINRKIVIILDKVSYSIYDSIKNWEKIVQNTDIFLKCHQSYIVNLDKVNCFDKKENKLHMNNGDLVKVSKGEMKKLIYKLETLFIQI